MEDGWAEQLFGHNATIQLVYCRCCCALAHLTALLSVYLTFCWWYVVTDVQAAGYAHRKRGVCCSIAPRIQRPPESSRPSTEVQQRQKRCSLGQRLTGHMVRW